MYLFHRSLYLLLARLSVLAVSTVVILYFRVIVIGQGSPQFVESDNPASFSNSTLTKLFTYSYVNTYNIWLLLNPYPLCYDWSMGSIPLVEEISDARNVITFAVILTIAVLLAYAASRYAVGDDESSHTNKHKCRLLFSLAMLLLPFVPASNLLFPVGFVIAERILYLPSMGYCLLLASGFNGFIIRQRSTNKMVSSNSIVSVSSESIHWFYEIIRNVVIERQTSEQYIKQDMNLCYNTASNIFFALCNYGIFFFFFCFSGDSI